MRDILDTPILFFVFTLLVLLALAHLMHAAFNHFPATQSLARFFALPDTSAA